MREMLRKCGFKIGLFDIYSIASTMYTAERQTSQYQRSRPAHRWSSRLKCPSFELAMIAAKKNLITVRTRVAA